MALNPKQRGRLGAFEKHPERVFGKNGITEKASRELEEMANELLGVGKGKKVSGIRQRRAAEELLFYSLEEDWMPELEPWDTRFP